MVSITGRESVNERSKTKHGFVQKSVTNGITAFAGGGQASATQLTSAVNRVATAATAADSVKLPAVAEADIGIEVDVINDGASSIQVFGAGTDTIDAVATATGVALAAAARCKYQLISYASGVGAWVSQKTVKSS